MLINVICVLGGMCIGGIIAEAVSHHIYTEKLMEYDKQLDDTVELLYQLRKNDEVK